MKTSANLLQHIRIIMVGTTLPANIGSAARAMHTMGLSDLVIVNPKLPIDETSYANAAGGQSVLDNAKILPNLPHALSECALVLAASARSRHLPRPVITPSQSSALINTFIHQHQAHHTPKVALLFGREDRGLTNEELSFADYHIQIPANPAYPVLNVASAIQVIGANLYDYFTHADTHTHPHRLTLTTRTDWDEPAINFTQKQHLENNIITLLTTLNLAREQELKDLPKRLSRLTSRMQLDQKEYALLQALINKLTNTLQDTSNL